MGKLVNAVNLMKLVKPVTMVELANLMRPVKTKYIALKPVNLVELRTAL